MSDSEMQRKAEAFDEIIAGYQTLDIDDFDSDWLQGSFYDIIVTRYLGIPTLWNEL